METPYILWGLGIAFSIFSALLGFIWRSVSGQQEKHQNAIEDLKSKQHVDDSRWQQQDNLNKVIHQNSEKNSVHATRLDSHDRSLKEFKDQVNDKFDKIDDKLDKLIEMVSSNRN